MSNRSLRILFFGTSSALSTLPLIRLLAEGYNIRAVVTPAPPGQTELVQLITPSRSRPVLPTLAPSLSQLCYQMNIPLLRIRHLRQPAIWEALTAFGADLVIVSCFPWRIPTAVIEAVPYGGLNLHPSRLPDGRGPDPLFWLYRRGELRTSLTLHQLSFQFDAGPIVLQQELDVPLGLPGDQLERILGRLGGWMLAHVLADLPTALTQSRLQDERRARTDPFPSPSDWTVESAWPTWRAVHFLRGVIPLGYRPVLIWPNGTAVAVGRLVTWAVDSIHAQKYRVPGSQCYQCRDGVLVIQPAND